MKLFISLLICFVLGSSFMHADDSKYLSAMKSNIVLIDSLKTSQEMQDLANSFVRIANAEKNKWLPFYYASYLNILAGFVEIDNSKKDSYLDIANNYLSSADSLQPNESEIYVLKGMLLQARLQVDPMNRFMKYGAEMNSLLQKAVELDSKNPRPEYLMGMTTYYTPIQFGGGAKAAKPMFENSIKKFNAFIALNELMPVWGKSQAEYFFKQIPN